MKSMKMMKIVMIGVRDSKLSSPHSEIMADGVLEPVFNDKDRKLISDVEHIPLIAFGLLEETWPDEFKVDDVNKDAGDSSIMLAITPSQPSKLPSLVDITLNAALDQCVSDEEGFENLDHVINLPGATATILARFKERPSFSATSWTFLRSLLDKVENISKRVNLSGYNLTGQQVGDFLRSVQEVEELDLSFNSIITEADLATLLSPLTSLKSLNLIGTALSNDDVATLLLHIRPSLPHLESIQHPFLIDPGYPLDTSLTLHLGAAASTVPLLSAGAAVQMIWNFLELNTKPTRSPRAMNKFNHMGTAYGIAVASFRRQDECWDDRFISLLPKPGYVAGNKQRSFIFYLRPHHQYRRGDSGDERPSFSYGFLAPVRQSDTDRSGNASDATDGLSLQKFFGRFRRDYQNVSTSDVTDETAEVLSFSAFIDRLKAEGFAQPSDSGKLEALAEAFGGMGLISIEECYKREEDY